MSVIKELSRLARIAARTTKYTSFQHIRPICIATPRILVKKQIFDKFQRGYAQWNPNVVKSNIPDVPIPTTTYTNFLWSKIESWPNHVALVCGVSGREVKYADLRKDCQKFGVSLLKELGIKPGQVIASILPNIIEYPPVSLGAIEAGVIISPMNPGYTADEIAFQIKDCEAVAVVTFPGKLEAVLEVKAKLNMPNLKVIVTPGLKDLPEGVISYTELIKNANPDELNELKPKKFNMNDTIIIPYSSGTTGKPKGVCLTHNNIVSNLLAMHHIGELEATSANHQDVVPAILPMFHIYGFSVLLGYGLSIGAKLIMLPKFEEETFLRSLKDYKATVLFVAPPLVIYLGNSPKVTKDHLKTVKMITSGAAPLGELDIEKCLLKTPPDLQYKQGYGLTETSPAICIMINDKKLYSSVGPPVANTLVKIIDTQTKQALGSNDEGEICVKGPQVMKGYYKNKEATDAVFDEEGWFHTGDVGHYDSEGFLYVTDRLKELIKVKGFQVPPAELESVLRSHPDVEDAGVIGVPHEINGETPIGYIKIKPGKSPDPQKLKEFLKDKVAKYKQINEFIFVDSIPKSAAGKILRKELRLQYQQKK